MIYYYTGTGNSRYVAKYLSSKTGDNLICLNDIFKSGESFCPSDDTSVVFVTPTYGWRIPRLVESWISRTAFPVGCKVWFVMTCGSEIGNAYRYIERLCKEKQFVLMGVKGIVMPENYIAMFDAPDKTEAESIIKKAHPDMEDVAEKIKNKQNIISNRVRFSDKLMSGVANPLFYKFFVNSKAFTVSDKCISCSKCADLCPLNNIHLIDGKPVWGSNCTHCMACICHCPVEAIEYGKKSAGQPRYHLD